MANETLVFSLVRPTGALALGTVLLRPGERCVIGRGSEADIVVTPTPTMSRAHAAVTNRDGRFFVEDLGSSGGTFVARLKARIIRPHELSSGEEFWLGASLVRIEIVPPTRDAARKS